MHHTAVQAGLYSSMQRRGSSGAAAAGPAAAGGAPSGEMAECVTRW
jgi:hypothetical protein